MVDGDIRRSYKYNIGDILNMFAAGGSYARLSCQQGADLWTDVVCKLVPFFMP